MSITDVITHLPGSNAVAQSFIYVSTAIYGVSHFILYVCFVLDNACVADLFSLYVFLSKRSDELYVPFRQQTQANSKQNL